MASTQRRSLRPERGSWRLEAKTTARILLILTLLGLLGWLCLTQASQVCTARYHLREKEEEKGRLQRENAELLAEIMEISSVSSLQVRALDLGYATTGGLAYWDVRDYPAKRVSGDGLAAVPRLDESDAIVLEEPKDEPLSVARWCAKVISRFVSWAGTHP